MERGKGSGRGGKNKASHVPVNLYLLGPKPNNDAKLRPILPKAAGQQPGERDRKREGSTLSSVVPSKKPKTGVLLNRPSTSSNSPIPGSSSNTSDAWEAAALEIDSSEFVFQVLEAAEGDDTEKVVGYICGAVKLLRSQRLKPDSVLYESLAYLTKIRPALFTNDCVVSALCSLLKKDNVYSFKTKGNTCVLTLVVSMLACAFQGVKKWPDLFIKVYLEDAGGERGWVDNELCKSFIDNIISSFNTKQITVSVDAAGRIDPQDDDLVPVLKQPALSEARADPIPIAHRFRGNRDAVESLIVDTVKEQLSRKQSPDLISRNFFKMLSSLCGISEVRLIIASRLEAWFQNPKLMRSAQELLMSLCANCTTHTIKDAEVINCLIKMRLKSKALCNYYLACIKELVSVSPENLSTALKQTIYNELSSSRNPNNMAMLSVMFQYDPEPAAVVLAEIFQELLLNREDYLRPLRALLREMSRVLRSELRLPIFCCGLMNRTDPLPRDCDNLRVFAATADLISLAIFLAVMPHARSEKKDSVMIERMQTIIANIQKDSVWWLQDMALNVYRPSPQDFFHAVQKADDVINSLYLSHTQRNTLQNLKIIEVLLLEPVEQYYKVDMWPPEQDRNLFMRMSTEVPVLEETLITILALGLSKDHPLTPVEALDISEQLVRRAATVQNPIIPVLKTDKIKVLDLVFNLCAYRHPENIDLPAGYSPPTLAISVLYWKGWTILLILSAHNPVHIGTIAWQKYPTLRVLMEMCITSHFAFPQGFDELQLLALEKQKILEFESHLAAASTKMEITEQTSLLLSQLVTMDPFGPARRPPPPTLELIKTLNTTLRLGHLLCRSRNPDFLLDIIHRQGASQSMPWLADLVHNSEGALNHLPVQCLCEFLLSSSHKQEGKYQQLLSHLQNILTDPQQDPSNACEVLDYFLKRLSSPSNRTLAIEGLKLVISPLSDEEAMEVVKGKADTSWLSQQLPLLPHFKIAKPQIIASLRSACQVENDPSLVTAYLCFLSLHADGDLSEMTDLVLDMAQLIVERSTIMGAILPNTDLPNPALDAFVSIFYNYITKAREPRREAYTWSESQDQVLVTWPTGEECTVHILVVHAIVILLTYGPTAVSKISHYNHLLDTWFPKELDKAPKGFLVDTSEEALLIPDWLKLRMIRSHVPRLVEAALTDLDIGQLILFIQSFGIPIASMSQLLATLDSAVLTDQDAVGEAVIDKAYMVQLVEVQHRRGAVSGETFTRVLDLLEPSKPQPMDIVDSGVSVRAILEKKQRIKQRFLSIKEGAAALDELFGKGPFRSTSQFEDKALKTYMEGGTSTKKSFTDWPDSPKSSQLREICWSIQRTLVHEMSSPEGLKGSSFLREFKKHLMNQTFTNSVFIYSIEAHPEYACPIFRLLITFNPNCVKLSHLCSYIIDAFTKIKTQNSRAVPLIKMLSQYVQNCRKVSASEPADIKEEDETDILTNSIEKLLTDSGPATGHLVDKLVRLEPEILGSVVDHQMRLLFSANELSTLQFRPYLLTLLTHHASWKTLNHCVNMLMNPDSVQKFESTPVLDFLTALICNPKLWQGREKHTPKHYIPEDVLNLSITQLNCMTDYIVAEAVNIMGAESFTPKSFNDKIFARMTLRLQLLTQCMHESEYETVTALAEHLIMRSKNTSGTTNHMCNQLIVQLYLKIPSLISHLIHEDMDKLIDSYSYLSGYGCSVMDVLSHTLLTALSSSSNSKDWPKRSQELELAVRKMAATHPLLVLRQLPLIASSLHGRVDLDWSVFKSRNHLLFFQQILNLLDLLQPAIFSPEHSTALCQTLDSFLDLFQTHGRDGGTSSQSVGSLVTHFVTFIQCYVKCREVNAQTYLQTKAEIISELQADYQVLGKFCIVVNGLEGGLEVILTPSDTVEQPNPQWDDKVSQLSKDPVSSLIFLDYSSVKRPSLLSPLLMRLCNFLTSPIKKARALAHTLLVRYLRHNPKAAGMVLPVYIGCLDSKKPDIVTSTLEKLPEVVVCSQELALPLLEKVFNLGMRCNISTLLCISKTISMLNLQSAC